MERLGQGDVLSSGWAWIGHRQRRRRRRGDDVGLVRAVILLDGPLYAAQRRRGAECQRLSVAGNAPLYIARRRDDHRTTVASNAPVAGAAAGVRRRAGDGGPGRRGTARRRPASRMRSAGRRWRDGGARRVRTFFQCTGRPGHAARQGQRRSSASASTGHRRTREFDVRYVARAGGPEDEHEARSSLSVTLVSGASSTGAPGSRCARHGGRSPATCRGSSTGGPRTLPPMVSAASGNESL